MLSLILFLRIMNENVQIQVSKQVCTLSKMLRLYSSSSTIFTLEELIIDLQLFTI